MNTDISLIPPQDPRQHNYGTLAALPKDLIDTIFDLFDEVTDEVVRWVNHGLCNHSNAYRQRKREHNRYLTKREPADWDENVCASYPLQLFECA